MARNFHSTYWVILGAVQVKMLKSVLHFSRFITRPNDMQECFDHGN